MTGFLCGFLYLGGEQEVHLWLAPKSLLLSWAGLGDVVRRVLLYKFGFPWIDSEVVFSKLGMHLQLFVVVWSYLKLHPEVGGMMKGAVSCWVLASGFRLRSSAEYEHHLPSGAWGWKWISWFQKYRGSMRPMWIVCFKENNWMPSSGSLSFFCVCVFGDVNFWLLYDHENCVAEWWSTFVIPALCRRISNFRLAWVPLRPCFFFFSFF